MIVTRDLMLDAAEEAGRHVSTVARRFPTETDFVPGDERARATPVSCAGRRNHPNGVSIIGRAQRTNRAPATVIVMPARESE